ncbi:MAG: ABC transporter substrate-binding protein [Actinomycetota bacterium]|nr:ABC transporter substrate-binding protein [Actinomycetota bacterium]
MKFTHSARTKVLAGFTIAALFAAACSDDEKSDTSTTEGTDTSVVTSDSTATTDTVAVDPLGEPNPATGDPILVGVINEGGGDTVNQQSENTLTGIKIAADYVNEYLGGIAGHPIEIVSCGNKNTPAGAVDCANQLVEQKVAFYVQPYSGFEADIAKILTAAGIPMINASSSSTEGLTTPGAFALSSGYPGTLGAMAIDSKANGVKKFAMLVTDVPAATGAAKALGGMTFGKMGVEYEIVTVPLGTADFTPMLQAAVSGGADAIGITGDATFCSAALQAYKTLGLEAALYPISVCLDPTVIESSGDVLDGARVATLRVPDTEDEVIFNAAVAKFGDSGLEVNLAGGVADGYSALLSAARAFAGYTGDIDNASIMTAMKAAADIEMPFTGGLTYTCDGTAIPILANVCSAQFSMATVAADGTLSDFTQVDASEAYAA